MLLFCRACDGANDFPRNWVTAEDTCKYCGSKEQWRTLNEPKKPYELSEMDKRLLRSLRIGQS
jgi:hypothetical protein